MGRRTLIASCATGAGGVAAAAAVTPLSLSSTLVVVAAVAALVALPVLVRAIVHTEVPTTAEAPFREALHALAARSARPPDRPVDLLALTRNAYDLNVRFRPFVAGLVRDLLAVRARVDLANEPERARALLGPELRELVWPARGTSHSYSDPGLAPDRLQRLLDDLEELERLAP